MSLLFHCPWENADVWHARIAEAMPDETIRVWPTLGDPAEIDVALVWRPPPGALARLPNLKAILSLGAGVEDLLRDPALPPEVPVARLVDPLMAERMADYVAGHVLRHHLDIAAYACQQSRAVWRRRPYRDAAERTVGLLGLGQMGRRAAARLAALGFRVVGWSRGGRPADGCMAFAGRTGLRSMLARTDILVCLLPLTPETQGILNAETLRTLPRGAAVINCARGDHLAEDQLIAALDDGHLSGATLDVFRTEPLPAGHPFWTHPKVLVTPHVSSLSEPRTGAEILAGQVARIRRGEPLLHRVDRQAGY